MEQFTCQGRTWTRRELSGAPVQIATRQSNTVSCPTKSVTWSGPHVLNDGERAYRVEQSTVHYAGRLGTSLTYIETMKQPGTALARVVSATGYKLK